MERNADIFFRDVPDCVNALLVGKVGSNPKPLVIAGGNCSILGFDKEGTESFWTVTGDNVSSMTFCDVDSDGKCELIVGSDDFEIRFFRGEELMSELTESDRVTFLQPVTGPKFAYGLANGTVGVYNGCKSKNRLWRVKTKQTMTALSSYDLNGDGVPEVITGWSNGTFTVRNSDTGNIIFKETMSSPITSILQADYRMDGKQEMIICSESGEVRGYLPADADFVAMSEEGIEMATEGDQKALMELQNKKLELTNELRAVEKGLRAKSGNSGGDGSAVGGVLPSGTTLNYSLDPDEATESLLLRVEASIDVIISCLVAVDLEGAMFEGSEVLAVSPPTLTRAASLPLKPSKNQACTLRIQTHIAVRSHLSHLHVFETDITIPTFSSFKKVAESPKKMLPKSYVTFKIKESTARLEEWIASAFILTGKLQSTPDKLNAQFVCVCNASKRSGAMNGGSEGYGQELTNDKSSMGTNSILHISAKRSDGDDSSFLVCKIRCEGIELASEIIQDMAKFFKISELDSEAEFPNEMMQFEEVLARVNDYNSSRAKLAVDMADDSQRVKALIIRAEDSRLMNDMDTMRAAYNELFSLNNQLIGGYNIRSNNHQGLLAALKEVNQMIQKAANLRVGRAKTAVINECRAAVKKNNMGSLISLITRGHAAVAVPS